MNQIIEVVIPVHETTRPLERGLRSVLDQRAGLAALGVGLGVTVVCHNVSVAELSNSLPHELASNDAVAWLPCNDGVNSPAGPRNLAIDRSGATFLCFLDSDDYLEAGSLQGWWQVAQEQQAAAVIAPLRTPAGVVLRSPRLRPERPAVLDPLKDGLAYRSVPYGLLRRTSLLDCGFRYAEGMPVGEDLETTLKLWFRGGRIVYPYGTPAYHQTDDSGPDRVTSNIRPLAEEFRWLEALVQASWLREAPRGERRSIALKLMRVHGIGALVRRGELAVTHPEQVWHPAEQAAWVAVSNCLYHLAGGALPALSRQDAALSQAAAETNSGTALRAAVALHARSGRFGKLMTAYPLALCSADSPLRHYVNERRRTKSGVFTLR